MNKIKLTGIIKNIQYSHTLHDTEYDKAHLIVKREADKEDILNLKFKRFSNPYENNQLISLEGNVRTFSSKVDGKNSVEVYVFTYFDDIEDSKLLNDCEVSGRICKKADLRVTKKGKHVLDFILANNIHTDGQTLNAYIPCVI